MEDADVILETGKHAGKRIRDLTDQQLRFVWAGINGGKTQKRRPIFAVLTRELHRREGTPCPSWALSPRLKPEANSVATMAEWLKDQSPDMMIAFDREWVASAGAFSGWATGPDLFNALEMACQMVEQARYQEVAA
jgi:hypothetical protein